MLPVTPRSVVQRSWLYCYVETTLWYHCPRNL